MGGDKEPRSGRLGFIGSSAGRDENERSHSALELQKRLLPHRHVLDLPDRDADLQVFQPLARGFALDRIDRGRAIADGFLARVAS
jgi:hypothetical protein